METFHYEVASLRETSVGITSQRHDEVSQRAPITLSDQEPQTDTLGVFLY